MIRRANPEIARGAYTALSIPDSKAGGFISVWQDSAVAVLHNSSNGSVTIDLSALTDRSFRDISAVIGAGSASLNGAVLRIEGQTSVILR
jgi:hypothetical protein